VGDVWGAAVAIADDRRNSDGGGGRTGDEHQCRLNIGLPEEDGEAVDDGESDSESETA
jgi:hypothetical protein